MSAGFGGSDGSVWVMGEWSVESGCHKLSENIWFVWSKTSYSGDKWIRCCRYGTHKQQVKIDTQLLIWETMSLAMLDFSLYFVLVLSS